MSAIGRALHKKSSRRRPEAPAGLRVDAVGAADVEWIPSALGRWACSLRWSEAWGQTPSPTAVSHLLWQNVFIQRAVRKGQDEMVGLFQVANFRADDGVADLELLVDPEHLHQVDPVLEEFLNRVFRDHPLRKLCLTAAADDLELTPHLAKVARQAGCLVEHRRRERDHYVDINLYEIWADGSAT